MIKKLSLLLLILLLQVAVPASSATRFYLPVSGAAAVSPTFGGGTTWTVTTGADRIRCVTTKSSTALTSKTITETNAAQGNSLGRQYVSDAISAGDITGTVKGIIRCSESSTDVNANSQVVIYVVSNDGATVRGQLIAFDNSALSNEFATTLTNSKFPKAWSGAGKSVTTVTAQANDRIVIEVGTRTSGGEDGSGVLNLGDTGATDCAEDETGTAANVPWIEFSADLFTSAATTVCPSANLLGVGCSL